MSVEDFGQIADGQTVQRIVLTGGGLTAKILTWGAVLQDLRLEGHAGSLVLGFESFAPYPEHSPYFGATAGRYANRIRDGHLKIDGQSFQLDTNFQARHMLHGGRAGTGKRLWTLEDCGADFVTLSILLTDGEMGFPGNMEIRQTFQLVEGGTLDIRMEATTDAPTVCNLAHHSYFNLGDGPDIKQHLLQVSAETYLPVDDGLIPTGELRPVAGTPYDFREATPLGPSIDQVLIDHNFCLSKDRTSLRPVAQLSCSASGVSMALHTTEPGIQVYDGSSMDVPVPGLDGRMMGPSGGIAMEPQVWPDAPHHPEFPQATLRPGETYRQHTQYVFSKDTP